MRAKDLYGNIARALRRAEILQGEVRGLCRGIDIEPDQGDIVSGESVKLVARMMPSKEDRDPSAAATYNVVLTAICREPHEEWLLEGMHLELRSLEGERYENDGRIGSDGGIVFSRVPAGRYSVRVLPGKEEGHESPEDIAAAISDRLKALGTIEVEPDSDRIWSYPELTVRFHTGEVTRSADGISRCRGTFTVSADCNVEQRILVVRHAGEASSRVADYVLEPGDGVCSFDFPVGQYELFAPEKWEVVRQVGIGKVGRAVEASGRLAKAVAGVDRHNEFFLSLTGGIQLLGKEVAFAVVNRETRGVEIGGTLSFPSVAAADGSVEGSWMPPTQRRRGLGKGAVRSIASRQWDLFYWVEDRGVVRN